MQTKILILFTISLFGYGLSYGQSPPKEKMAQLSFMIGNWVGTSSIISNDTISKQGPVFEKIAYKLDKKLITIDLTSSMLQLHTVIYYDEKDSTYYYSPYSKSGNGKYRAECIDGKFVVWFNTSKRLVFQLTAEGNFQEYGETLVEGKWHQYFKDVLQKSP